jgi:CopG family transcriptional regulator/antitoxin EndoAI
MKHATAYRRINITLPERALRLVDRVAPRGDRSRFIAAAISHYVSTTSRAKLKKDLRDGARARATRDRVLATEWFDLEEEVWPRGRG